MKIKLSPLDYFKDKLAVSNVQLGTEIKERCDKLAVCNVQLGTEIKERCDKLVVCNVQLY